jgi:hypothetical protein
MDFCTLHTLKASATACLPRLLQLEVELDSEPADAAPQIEDAKDDQQVVIVNAAAAVAPSAVVASVSVRRKCSKCGSLTHQSNNRVCPNFKGGA